MSALMRSRTRPMAPAWTHSAICGAVWFPAAQNMCVAAPVWRAVWTTRRASWKTLPSGLWTITCFPAFIAASATVAWRWSGVMM